METIIGGFLGVLIAALVFIVLIVVFKWLWNITAPEILNLKTITFWQAVRILILASILFGGHRVTEISVPNGGAQQPAQTEAR